MEKNQITQENKVSDEVIGSKYGPVPLGWGPPLLNLCS